MSVFHIDAIHAAKQCHRITYLGYVLAFSSKNKMKNTHTVFIYFLKASLFFGGNYRVRPYLTTNMIHFPFQSLNPR